MKPVCLTLLVLSSYTLASPLPQKEMKMDGEFMEEEGNRKLLNNEHICKKLF